MAATHPEGDAEAIAASRADPARFASLEGLTYEEAATALQVPVGTVRSRLSRARAELEHAMEEPRRPRAAQARASERNSPRSMN